MGGSVVPGELFHKGILYQQGEVYVPVSYTHLPRGADQNTEGGHYGFASVCFFLASRYGDYNRRNHEDAIVQDKTCVIKQTALPYQEYEQGDT